MTDTTDTTDALIVALIRAQQKIGNVTKNAANEFFKNPKGKPSKFVDLAQLNSVVLPALHEEGLFLTQRVDYVATADSQMKPVLVTQIIHESGDSLEPSTYPIVAKDMSDPQKFGAGVTYARRYALMAYLGIAAEDDDGNTAATPKPNAAKQLLDALVAAGYDTKEKRADALKHRFEGAHSSIATLQPQQIDTWINDLKDQKAVPF